MTADEESSKSGARPRRSMLDVAAAAGVSASTVSRYLNGQSVRQRQSIEQAIKKLQFVPSHSARSLKIGQSTVVAVVGPDTTNPFFAQIVSGAESVARQYGYSIELVNVDLHATVEQEASDVLKLAGRVDGIILTPLSEDSNIGDRLRGVGLPVVLLEHDRRTPPVDDLVVADHYQGAVEATNYLVQLGHRRIAAIYPRLTTTGGRLKRDGVRDALREHGIEPIEDFEVGRDYGRETGYNAMVELFTNPLRPTAVISCSSLLTIGALRAIRDLGIKVPGELSLIAIDNHELFDLLTPPITVVDRPMKEQGATAMRLLLAGLRSPGPRVPRTIVMQTHLIARGSCAPLIEQPV